MSKIAIITAVYDNYDSLKEICPQSSDVEWICVSDAFHGNKTLNGWKIVYEPRPHLHPNRAAKTPKCLPWLYTDAPTSIWIDASYQVVSPNFAEETIRYADPIAQFRHPWRDCAYAEAEESVRLVKYSDQIEVINDQKWDLKHIYEHPYNWGLWATGVIARKHTTQIISMGFDWLHQIYLYSFQDQISHPNCVRMHIGEKPVDLPGTHLSNDWLDYRGSGRH